MLKKVKETFRGYPKEEIPTQIKVKVRSLQIQNGETTFLFEGKLRKKRLLYKAIKRRGRGSFVCVFQKEIH